MNRKGTVMYLIFLGILIGIGAFFILRSDAMVDVKVKGEWQLDFLQENFLVAERQLIQTDSSIKNIGSQLALDLANNGGFKPDTVSNCGQYAGVNLWNNGNRWCSNYQDILQLMINLTEEKLIEQFPNKTFFNIGIDGFFLVGQGNPEIIRTENAKYTYLSNFAINLGYPFDEYLIIQNSARELLSRCKNENDLKSCLNSAKPTYWKYTSCEEEQYPPLGRTIPFCVNSPNLALLPLGNFFVQPEIPLTYSLALDFSSSTIFSIDQFTVTCTLNNCNIRLPQNLPAQQYTIHYSNWEGVADSSGSAEDVFSVIIEDLGYFYNTAVFTNPVTENCHPLNKNQAHLCSNEITYFLEDSNLVPGYYFFTITFT